VVAIAVRALRARVLCFTACAGCRYTAPRTERKSRRRVEAAACRLPKAMRIRHNLTNFGQCGSCMKTRKSTTRLPKVVALALAVEATSLMPVSLVRAASDCSTLITLADWGENSTGDIDVRPGGSCLFPIRMRGTVSSSGISQKPAHGNLKRLNISTYEYTAKARYKGSDTFAIKATGQGPTGSGTSVITVHATIK
jgi:hypothetical protein